MSGAWAWHIAVNKYIYRHSITVTSCLGGAQQLSLAVKYLPVNENYHIYLYLICNISDWQSNISSNNVPEINDHDKLKMINKII